MARLGYWSLARFRFVVLPPRYQRAFWSLFPCYSTGWPRLSHIQVPYQHIRGQILVLNHFQAKERFECPLSQAANFHFVDGSSLVRQPIGIRWLSARTGHWATLLLAATHLDLHAKGIYRCKYPFWDHWPKRKNRSQLKVSEASFVVYSIRHRRRYEAIC